MRVITYLPKPSSETISADKLLTMMVKKILNPNPVGQRISTDSANYKKSSGIIISIFEGSDIGELTLIKRPDGKYIVIDGGHRSRAIKDFVGGKFTIPKDNKTILETDTKEVIKIAGKKYSELPNEARQYFDDYVIRLCVYDNLSSIQETKIFRNRNQSTPVNHQEMMNAASDNLIAIFVRETSRGIPDHKPKYPVHDIFTIDANKDKPMFLGYPNTRLCWDEWVAILSIYAKEGKIVDAGYPEIENLYVDGDEYNGTFAQDTKSLNKLTEDVKECLDFCQKVAIGLQKVFSPSAPNLARMTMAARYFFYLKSQNKSFKLSNPNVFAATLATALYDLVGKTGKVPEPAAQKWEQTLVDKSLTNDPNPLFVPTKMREWMSGYHAESTKVIQTILWLEEAMNDIAENSDGDIGIKFTDTKRSLSMEERQLLLAKQDFKCYIDGLPLDLKNAAAGHIVPHCDGGLTIMSNCRMVRRKWNSEMGSMHLEEYKTSWDARNSRAA